MPGGLVCEGRSGFRSCVRFCILLSPHLRSSLVCRCLGSICSDKSAGLDLAPTPSRANRCATTATGSLAGPQGLASETDSLNAPSSIRRSWQEVSPQKRLNCLASSEDSAAGPRITDDTLVSSDVRLKHRYYI